MVWALGVRHRWVAALVATFLALPGCMSSGVSPTTGSVTSASGGSTTAQPSSVSTTSRAATTTAPMESTSTTVPWVGPEPCSDCDGYVVVTTVPVVPVEGLAGDGDGVTYDWRGDEPFWGPAALVVDAAGVFWIADSLAADGRRLIRVDPSGAWGVVGLPEDVISVLDIAPLPEGIAVLWINAVGHAALLLVDEAGTAIGRVPLSPVDFGGFSGLSLAVVAGQLFVEVEWGLHAAAIDIPGGGYTLQRGYTTPAGFYSIRPLRTPTATIPYTVSGNLGLGTVRLVGINPDGSLVVMVDDLSQTPSGQLQVRQVVSWYEADGLLAGRFEFPLAEQVAGVDNAMCLGADGYVYGLLTRSDHVDIVRFNYPPGS